MSYSLLVQTIANEVQSAGLGTTGTDLFVGQLPEDVSQGLFLVTASAPPANEWVDTQDEVIDFWIRSDHTDAGYRKLQDIYNMYNRRANYQLNDWYIYFSQAISNIMDMDRDREGGKLLKLSVSFKCRNINNVS